MQIAGFIVTDGGPHPADKWADMTANQIVDTLLRDGNLENVSPEAQAARLAKRKLRNDLFEVFMGHHDRVQQHERGECRMCKNPAEAAARLLASHDPSPHMSIMDEVNALFAASPFADHLAKPEVQAIVQQIIGQHTVDVMHIERRWHHDRMTTKGA